MSMIFGDVSRTWMLQEIRIKGDRINGLQPYNISHLIYIFVGELTHWSPTIDPNFHPSFTSGNPPHAHLRVDS